MSSENTKPEPPEKTVLCLNQPISMIEKCKRFAAGFAKNVDAIKMLVDGCVDKTTLLLRRRRKGFARLRLHAMSFGAIGGSTG